jgi:hypothetical protein
MARSDVTVSGLTAATSNETSGPLASPSARFAMSIRAGGGDGGEILR